MGGGAGGVKIVSRPSLEFSFSQAEQNIFHTQERGGGTKKCHTQGKQTFLHQGGRTNIFTSRWGQTFFTFLHRGRGQIFLCRRRRQTSYVGGGGGYDDIDKEMNVSQAKFLVHERRKQVPRRS